MSIKKEDIDKLITDFCLDIIRQPFLHFSEADLQPILVEKLRKIDSLKKINLEKDNKIRLGYKTSLIHREYGANKKERIDIVIFNDSDVKKINTFNLTYKPKKEKQNYLQPTFGFELGSEKCKLEYTKKHITSDINKLKNCTEIGYIIHIIRDIAVTRDSTTKRKKTEKRIKKKFKDVIETQSKNAPDKIRIIAIRLNPYRIKQDNWIKCEIFDKYKEEKWHKLYENDIQYGEKISNLIKKQLK